MICPSIAEAHFSRSATSVDACASRSLRTCSGSPDLEKLSVSGSAALAESWLPVSGAKLQSQFSVAYCRSSQSSRQQSAQRRPAGMSPRNTVLDSTAQTRVGRQAGAEEGLVHAVARERVDESCGVAHQ